jgi:hypothetical protein
VAKKHSLNISAKRQAIVVMTPTRWLVDNGLLFPITGVPSEGNSASICCATSSASGTILPVTRIPMERGGPTQLVSSCYAGGVLPSPSRLS